MGTEEPSLPAWANSAGFGIAFLAILWGSVAAGERLGWPSYLPYILPALLVVVLFWKVVQSDDVPMRGRDPIVGFTVLQWALVGLLGYPIVAVLVETGFIASGFLTAFVFAIVTCCVIANRRSVR